MSPTIEVTLLASSAAIFAAVALCVSAIGPLWDIVARRRIAELTPRLQALGLDDARLPIWMRWWGLSLFGSAGVVGLLLRMPILVPAVVYLVYVAPAYLLRARIARRRNLLRDQLAVASVALANTARAGLSLAQGLESIAAETPEPLAGEFRRIVREFQRGRPLAEAIAAAKERLKLDGITLLASAILACLDRGGRITDTLQRIAASLEESQRLERKLDADTASGRKVIVLLGGFPVVFLAIFAAVDPSGTGLVFQTVLGQLILLVVIVLIYVSVKLGQAILNLDI
jgi:tight adherence protein B